MIITTHVKFSPTLPILTSLLLHIFHTSYAETTADKSFVSVDSNLSFVHIREIRIILALFYINTVILNLKFRFRKLIERL